MAVSEVLEFVPLVGFGRVVGGGVGTRFDDGAAIKMEGDVAAQADGARDPRARGELDGAASGSGRGFDGFINGLAILRFAIAFGAEGSDIKSSGVEAERRGQD